MQRNFLYTGLKTKEISFPLGGIGSGSIGFAGNGRLIDWEIRNKPDKGSTNGFSHLAVKAEIDGQVIDTRVMQGDLPAPYMGFRTGDSFGGFGFGPSRYSMAGVPHFKESEFTGEYPFAQLSLHDDHFPGDVSITAFNPLIPLNDRESSIPAAFFDLSVRNTTERTVDYTFVLSVRNPFEQGTTINTFGREDGMSYIHFTQNKYGSGVAEYGDLCIGTDATDTSYQEYWYRGPWFDNLGIYWRDLTTPGKFRNRKYDKPPGTERSDSKEDMGSLAVHISVGAGNTGHTRFLIGWNFPNCINYWKPECKCGDDKCGPTVWKNWYATVFDDSVASSSYAFKNWQRLYEQTREFKDLFFSSTLPPEVLDAVSSNIAILKSPTVLRLEDGTLYGWEGCHPAAGCCEGSCTHVWNYAYALPFLFPALERSMRDADYEYNLGADGDMTFRLQLPLGSERIGFRPCADGQFGNIIMAYRDWKISGDDQWLASHWEHIKRSLEYAWSQANTDRWDLDRDGVLEGRQHHTLDMELFGPNAWLTGFYLGALKAAAEMARHFGDEDTAHEYEALFLKGRDRVEEELWNGEYYQQKVDLTDKSILESFSDSDIRYGKVTDAYWSDEHQEIKYQVADGCIIDQVLAQWHANIAGLGDIFDPDKRRTALASIYRYNFRRSMRDFFNPCRLYSLDDESGVIICSFPGEKPAVPVPYAEETMNGFEYQVACHMIQEGLVDEGLEIVRAVRDRFDGEKRNPWNEFECGSNYARSMASYALLTTLSGFEFDMVAKHVGFNPIARQIARSSETEAPTADFGVGNTERFRCFWCIGTGWGVYEQEARMRRFRVAYGTIELASISVPGAERVESVTIGSTQIEHELRDGVIGFVVAQTIDAGGELTIRIS